MSGTLKHQKVTGIPNTSVSLVGGADWDHEHVFSGGSDGQVLVRDSAQSDGISWTATPSLTRLGVGSAMLAKSALIVRGASTVNGTAAIFQSGDVTENNDAPALVVVRGADGSLASTCIDAFGAINTVVGLRILGNLTNVGTVDADGTFHGHPYHPTGLESMIDLAADVKYAIGIRPYIIGDGVSIQCLDYSYNFVFSVEQNGLLRWGAANANIGGGTLTHDAMDCSFGRSAANVLSTPNLLAVDNTTPATAVVTTRDSPAFRWTGTAWDTAASQTVDFRADVGAVSAAAPWGYWRLGFFRNGSFVGYPFMVGGSASTNLIVGVNNAALLEWSVNNGGTINISGAGGYWFNSRTHLYSPADGHLNILTAAETAGIRLDASTNGLVKVLKPDATYGTIDCLGLKASGVAGTSFGPSAVATLTVVNGIVTAHT